MGRQPHSKFERDRPSRFWDAAMGCARAHVQGHPTGYYWILEVFMGQIFSPISNPPRKVWSKSIPPQIQTLMGHPTQSISKQELFLLVSC